ncbi:chloramphenicol phosphotransferase CPT family protein [Indiicoccus explosivorum]|uniref:chloramphenicol phosphotransferase CPT family protein n=1 Tax=Indiicoccus explosivorum TaxID=1917864 RepID=UPI0013901169|nr:AAA family ATPase [Indiicoccus explosivorum]
MEKGIIVVLNGTSSSGKTSIAKELIKLEPSFFHAELDSYDKFIEEMEERGGERLIPVPTERLFHRTLALLSDEGVHTVADTVLHDPGTLSDFYRLLTGYPVFFVGVFCAKPELERREKARGDRRVGLAASQLDFIHRQNEPYRLTVDTSMFTAEQCAARIAAAVRQSGMLVPEVRSLFPGS